MTDIEVYVDYSHTFQAIVDLLHDRLTGMHALVGVIRRGGRRLWWQRGFRPTSLLLQALAQVSSRIPIRISIGNVKIKKLDGSSSNKICFLALIYDNRKQLLSGFRAFQDKRTTGEA